MKKLITSILPAGGALAALALAVSPVSGTILLLDFGPTTPTGGNLTNSPYHSSEYNGTETSWNILGTADSSSLLWGDGTAATGVAIDLGRSNNNSLINFADQPGSSNALGVQTNSGVFSGNSVGKDGIFHGSGGQNNVIGLKVTGLALGTYDVFVVGINTNIEQANETIRMDMGALATGNVGTLDIAALSTVTVGNTVAASWQEGGNYGRFNVTLTADNPVLTLFTVATDSTEGRGFLNAVQVTPIPEPRVYAALFGLFALGFVAWRRRR